MTLHFQAPPSRFRQVHRRIESRARVALETRVQTLHGRVPAYLLNLSCHGAMLQMVAPPGRGNTVIVICGPLDGLGTIVWSEDDRCGVEFEEPIAEEMVIDLRHMADEAARYAVRDTRPGRLALGTRPLTREEWKIAQDWILSSDWR
jgi:hypothetical protein